MKSSNHTTVPVINSKLTLSRQTNSSLRWTNQSKLRKTYNSHTHMKNLTVFSAQQVRSVLLLPSKFQRHRNLSSMITKVSTFSCLTGQDQCVARESSKPIKLWFFFWCHCHKIRISTSSVSDQSLTDFTTKVKSIPIRQLKRLLSKSKVSQPITEVPRLLNHC